MAIYFSKSTNGFYDSTVHTTMPADVVEITQAEWMSLMASQSLGKIIQADANGNPIAVDPPAPTAAELQAQCKQQAMALLAATDWVELPSVTNTSNAHHLVNAADFLAYRIAVRALAVDPVTNPMFPALPVEQWS
jgi:hypothetical protein